MKMMKHAANLEELGTFIRDRRRILGLTQTELAERLGYVQERISLLERGRYGMPSLPALADLADALEISLAEMLHSAGFEMEGPDGRPSLVLVAPPGPGQRSVRRLSDENRRIAAGLADLNGRLEQAHAQIESVNALSMKLKTRQEQMSGLVRSLRAGRAG